MKPLFNIKGLGKMQRQIISRMIRESIVIRSVIDYNCIEANRKMECTTLQDEEGDNIYQDISSDFVKSLHGRGLIFGMTHHPAENIEIITFRIKKPAIDFIATQKISL